MADYFTYFSLELSLPDVTAQNYALELARQGEAISLGEDPPAGFPASLTEVAENWSFETEAASSGNGLWLHSENGGIDAVCAFVQHLLGRFDPAGSASLEWSNDCSRPRTDAYGGGAAFITAKRIRHINTTDWLLTQARARKSKQKGNQ